MNPFQALKTSIMTAPVLGLPDYTKTRPLLDLHAREASGAAMGVQLPQHGSNYRPITYLSKRLDNVAKGMPTCLRALVALIVRHTKLMLSYIT